MYDTLEDKVTAICQQLSLLLIKSHVSTLIANDTVEGITTDPTLLITKEELEAMDVDGLKRLGFVPWDNVVVDGHLLMLIPIWLYLFMAINVEVIGIDYATNPAPIKLMELEISSISTLHTVINYGIFAKLNSEENIDVK